MGVLGLTPFLLKTCPHVLQRLPNRFLDIYGKTIVIDATLVTQRLHYAQIPHPYRHVLGWYRLCTELRNQNVNVICVFDGRRRILAKAEENARREAKHRVLVLRTGFEASRSKRLLKLRNHLSKWRDDRSRFAALAAVVTQLSQTSAPPPSALPRDSINELPSHSWEDAFAFTEAQFRDDYHVIPSQDLQKVAVDMPNDSIEYWTSSVDPNSISQPPPDSPHDPTAGPPQTLSDSVQPRVLNSAVAFDADLEAICSLYIDFRKSLPVSSRLLSDTSDAVQEIVEEDSLLLSKKQVILGRDEVALWDSLASVSPQAIDQARELAGQSAEIVTAYEKRMIGPTTDTYLECKELLNVMKVPFLETEGSCEAEGLASSIVAAGWADYVASEDTDVLLYNAPLLRGTTSRHENMILLDPSLIVKGLSLQSHDDFLEFALLLGTDFSPRIKNVGPSRAMKGIQQFKTAEKLVESLKGSKYDPKEQTKTHLSKLREARMVFTTVPPIPEEFDRAIESAGAETKSGRIVKMRTPNSSACRCSHGKIRSILGPQTGGAKCSTRRERSWRRR
ncbi:PIN domain-like protein [Flagelloscypha sp. PMI_526]|nr:PIN domain-like protein [Flagelloscypha sp. PMI_526]